MNITQLRVIYLNRRALLNIDLCHKIVNNLNGIIYIFLITEINFEPIPIYDGSFSVSDNVFINFQGFSESSDDKKKTFQLSVS